MIQGKADSQTFAVCRPQAKTKWTLLSYNYHWVSDSMRLRVANTILS